MKTLTKLILITFVLLTTYHLQLTASFAEIPHLINYQGKLTDSDGRPITGTKSITFRIYDVSSGGTPLWTETQSVTVDKGIFNVLLGSSTDLDLPFDKPYYLGIKVETDAEMSPRQLIASSAYALRAKDADDSQKLQGNPASSFAQPGHTHDASSIVSGTLSGARLKVYDSGWFAVTVNAAYTKNHNLGTTKFIPFVWFSTSPSGDNPILTNWDTNLSHLQGARGRNQGYTMYNVTPTQLTIFTGEAALAEVFTGGNSRTNYNSGYYRILAIALE